MSGALLTSQDREEALSLAYLHAIAAGAGYAVALTNFDRDGIDAQVQAGGTMRPCLGVQLKATINLAPHKDGTLRYPLKKRNFDLLRVETMVPRILVVLDLPQDEASWLTVTTDELALRKCAYWASLAGQPDPGNPVSVTVTIERRNLFDVQGLVSLMDQARSGAIKGGAA